MVFTVNEEKRIICLFAIYESPTEVRRRYINEYYIAPRVASTLQLTQFIRVWKRFQERGGLSKFQGQHRKGTGLPGTDEANASIIRHFDFHPKDSKTKAAADLGLSRTTTWRVARAAKMKPYKVLKTHQIKETNFGWRLTFGVWCLSKIETAADFTSRVIFSDEKWWVLDSSPNSQNDRRWSLVNPREYAECKYQGKKKVMCWMGFLQGAVLGPFWFVDEQQRPITLNQFSYLNMLEHDLWPVLRERRNLRRIWFMQDGATCHCTGRVLSWLGTKFNDRIISRRTPIPWPPQSPDLNPLDFWLWGHLGKIVHGANPRSIGELMQTVEDARNTITPDNIEESLRNLTKRLQSCVAQNGGHFQHLL